MHRYLRRAAALLGPLSLLTAAAVRADTFTGIDVRQGVEIGVLWNNAAQQTFSFPLEEGKSYPLGDKRLLVRVPGSLLAEEARRHEIRLESNAPRQTSVHAGQPADDGMTFEIPLALSPDLGRTELALSLVRDRRPLGIDLVRVASLTLVASDEEIHVVSVNRYPQLAWNGCPAPCSRRPAALSAISDDDWRQALEVTELDERGLRRAVSDFEVRLSPERPVSIVYAVDISGSILYEGGGDPSRRILEHFATFPDRAYGSDRVRDLDRLAMLFFNEEIVGYYTGGVPAGSRDSLIGDSPRFFAPRELAPSWDAYCEAADSEQAAGRMDEAWLAGAETAMRLSGLPVPEVQNPAEVVCDRSATTGEILDLLRRELRRCEESDGCRLRLPATDVLPALRRAAADLALLRQRPETPSSVRGSQQAVILISDGLDVPSRTADPRARDARFRQMRAALRDQRFFFIDVHSDLALTEVYARAHAGQAPLYDAVFDGIRQYVVEPDLGQLLIASLALHDDRPLRARLLAQLESNPLEMQLAGAPLLARTLAGALYEGRSLYAAFVEAVEQRLPEDAQQLLRGRLVDDRRRALEEPWVRRVAGASWIANRSQAKSRPDPRRLRAEVAGLKSVTLDRFYELARDLDGLAVSAEGCVHAVDGESVISGPACAFRKILGALRGTLHVRYSPGHSEGIEDVEIRLTPFGQQLLADRQMPGARLSLDP